MDLFGNSGDMSNTMNVMGIMSLLGGGNGSSLFGKVYALKAVAGLTQKFMANYANSIPVETLADKFAAKKGYNPNTISDEDMQRYEQNGKFLIACKDYFKQCDGSSGDMTLTACNMFGKLAEHYENNPAMLGYCVENFNMFFVNGDTIMDAANNIAVKSEEAKAAGVQVTGDMIKGWVTGQAMSGFMGEKQNEYVYGETEIPTTQTQTDETLVSDPAATSDPTATSDSTITDAYKTATTSEPNGTYTVYDHGNSNQSESNKYDYQQKVMDNYFSEYSWYKPSGKSESSAQTTKTADEKKDTTQLE